MSVSLGDSAVYVFFTVTILCLFCFVKIQCLVYVVRIRQLFETETCREKRIQKVKGIDQLQWARTSKETRMATYRAACKAEESAVQCPHSTAALSSPSR